MFLIVLVTMIVLNGAWQIDPSDALEALKKLSNKEAKLTSNFLIVMIGVVYAVILSLNSWIVPSYFLTVR